MDDWKYKYDETEKGWILNAPQLIRVRRKLMGQSFCGFVDEKGTEIIPCKYIRHSYHFYCGMLKVVDENGKIGFVNDAGKEVVKCQYDEASDFEDDYACVCKYKKEWNSMFREYLDVPVWGMIDKQGNIIIPLQYRFLGFMGKNRLLAEHSQTRKAGALDYSGNVIIPFAYYQLGKVTTDNRIEYSKGEGQEHGFMDLNGNIIQILPF